MPPDDVHPGPPERRYTVVYLIDGLGMGGAERLMVPLLRHLDRERFVPHVGVLQVRADNPMEREIRSLGVPVTRLPVERLRDLTALPRLLRFLRGVEADVVHTQLEFANILGNLAARILRLPSVCTAHVLLTEERRLKTRLHEAVEWAVLRFFCDQVIAVSDEARRQYLERKRLAPEKVTTLYNGIDLVPFTDLDRSDARRAVRRELGIPLEARVLITVAVLRPPKGIRFMIRALPDVLRRVEDAFYLIVGDGPDREALVEVADEAGVRERVVFAGMRDDVPRLLAAGDVFVLPTLSEALPTVLAEAMASRLPVVASAVGGVPQMVDEGVNGLLVPPGDSQALARACLSLLTDPARRAEMGQAGWEIVQRKFDVRRQVRALEELYIRFLRAYGR